MSDPALSDFDFKNEMDLVRTTLKSQTVPRQQRSVDPLLADTYQKRYNLAAFRHTIPWESGRHSSLNK